jgi:hypothetical protein
MKFFCRRKYTFNSSQEGLKKNVVHFCVRFINLYAIPATFRLELWSVPVHKFCHLNVSIVRVTLKYSQKM